MRVKVMVLEFAASLLPLTEALAAPKAADPVISPRHDINL
jgi:hypothetical protein